MNILKEVKKYVMFSFYKSRLEKAINKAKDLAFDGSDSDFRKSLKDVIKIYDKMKQYM